MNVTHETIVSYINDISWQYESGRGHQDLDRLHPLQSSKSSFKAIFSECGPNRCPLIIVDIHANTGV